MNNKLTIIKQIQESKNGILLQDIITEGITVKQKKEILNDLIGGSSVNLSTLSDLYIWVKPEKRTQENRDMGTARTSASLRDILFDEIDKLRAGKSNPKQAKAVAVLAQNIIKSAEVELVYQKMKINDPNVNKTPMLLGQQK